LGLSQRAYEANDPRTKVGMGCGWFNLITRSAYQKIGTHAAFRLRPDDDMCLGERVKKLGLTQRVLYGGPLLRTEWYPSLRAALRGFDKNAFAGFDYNLPKVFLAAFALGLIYIWPYIAVWNAVSVARVLLLGNIVATAMPGLFSKRPLSQEIFFYVPVLPLIMLLWIYVLFRSAGLALWHGGVCWRGTLYALKDLKTQGPGGDFEAVNAEVPFSVP